MHLFSAPVIANIYYAGGGSVGLVVLIMVLVMVFRRQPLSRYAEDFTRPRN